MNRYQTYLVDFLKKIKVFCDDNDIQFFIAYGEMIGAVRHHGFIPWDDDLDLVIKRSEYRKLIAKRDRLADYGLELICKDIDPEYEIVLSRLSDTAHTSIMPSGLYAGYGLGLRIDVFILDPVPSEKFDEHRKNVMMYEAIGERGVVKTNKAVEFMDEYKRLKKEEEEIGHEAVMNKIRAEVEKYTEEESDIYYVRWSPIDFYYDKKLFDEPGYIEFEGTMFPCPGHPQEYLRKTYGYNWYMVPAIADARIHKLTVNLDIGYKNYTQDVYQFFDLDEARQVSRKKKVAHMYAAEAKEPVQDFRRKVRAKYICGALGSADKGGALKKLFDEGRYNELIAAAEPLLSSIKYLRAGNLEELGDAGLVSRIIRALIYSGKYYTADKVRKYFRDQYADSEEYSEAITLLDNVIRIAVAYQDHEDEVMKEMIGVIDDKDGIIPDVLIAMIDQFFKDNKTDDAKTLIERCDKYLGYFPGNYDIIKRKGDLLYFLGEKEEARRIYDDVYANGRNGMDNLDLELNHGYSGRKYDEMYVGN